MIENNDTIYISKLNETYVKINCENRGILKEISDHFSFYAPNYNFHPLYRAKKWNGLIKLFNLLSQTLQYGSIAKLIKFSKDRNYNIIFDKDFYDSEKNNTFSLEDAKKYIKSLDLSDDKGNILPIREYQINSFYESIKEKRLVLLSPTGSGKSLIIYCIIRYILDHNNYKGLLLVPTVSLVSQMYGDFKDYSKRNKWDVKKYIHEIFQGKEKNSNKPLNISTWQSIYEQVPEYFKQYDFLIVDETHLATSKSITYIGNNCINAKYRIGTTGTLSGEKVSELQLNGLFGKTFQLVSTKKLIDDNHLAKMDIKCVLLSHDHRHPLRPHPRASYDEEIDYIISHKSRNSIIEDLVLKSKGNSLILFRFVEKHGQILYENLFKKNTDKTRKIFFLHGKTPKDEREKIRKQIEKETNSIVVGSSSLISTGTNIKNLHNIIFAHPYKGKIRNLQSIGRGLRIGSNKKSVTIYDIADNFNHKQPNFSLEHLKIRLKVYKDEKFKVQIYKLNLPPMKEDIKNEKVG